MVDILVSTKFASYLEAIHPRDQERCLRSLDGFETNPDLRSRSQLIMSSRRRRLHWLKVSDRLKAIYAVLPVVKPHPTQTSREGYARLWLWVGNSRDFDPSARRLDMHPDIEESEEMTIESHVSPDTERSVSTLRPRKRTAVVAAVKTDVNEQAPPVPPSPPVAPASVVKPPQDVMDKLSESIDGVAVYVSDAREAIDKIRKRHSEFLLRSSMQEKLSFDLTAIRNERDTVVQALKASKAKADMHEKLVADLNATKVEKDRLFDELRAANKKVDSIGAELASVRSKAVTTKIALPPVPAAVSDDFKDRCARLCEDFAAKLKVTGRPRDEDEADDFVNMAKKIRMLK